MAKTDKNKTFLIVAIFFLLVVAIFASSTFFRKTSTQDLRVGANTSESAIFVTASDDALSPSYFELGHFDTRQLNITAVDKEYVFQLPEFGIDEVIPMGQTKQVELVGLAVGTHEFICGETCRGSVTVYGKSDEEN